MNSLQQINGTWQVQCQDCITVSNNPGHALQCTCGSNKCLGCCCDQNSSNSEDIWADTNSDEDPDYNPDEDDEDEGCTNGSGDEEDDETLGGFIDDTIIYEDGYAPDPNNPEQQLDEEFDNEDIETDED